MGLSSNTVSTQVTLYGHSRSLSFPASLDYYSGSLPSRFPQRNRLAGPVETVAPVLVPSASPEFWCPHVQTARPSQRSFFREFAPRGSRGPRIYASHTPRLSHMLAAPLLVLKRHFRPRPGAPAEPNHPPW